MMAPVDLPALFFSTDIGAGTKRARGEEKPSETLNAVPISPQSPTPSPDIVSLRQLVQERLACGTFAPFDEEPGFQMADIDYDVQARVANIIGTIRGGTPELTRETVDDVREWWSALSEEIDQLDRDLLGWVQRPGTHITQFTQRRWAHFQILMAEAESMSGTTDMMYESQLPQTLMLDEYMTTQQDDDYRNDPHSSRRVLMDAVGATGNFRFVQVFIERLAGQDPSQWLHEQWDDVAQDVVIMLEGAVYAGQYALALYLLGFARGNGFESHDDTSVRFNDISRRTFFAKEESERDPEQAWQKLDPVAQAFWVVCWSGSA